MNTPTWALLIGGAVFTVGALAGFLFALAHGLRTQRWWPLGLIVTLWLAAMAGYSLWDGAERRALAHERATATSQAQEDR